VTGHLGERHFFDAFITLVFYIQTYEGIPAFKQHSTMTNGTVGLGARMFNLGLDESK
jgi:hypothetical protein